MSLDAFSMHYSSLGCRQTGGRRASTEAGNLGFLEGFSPHLLCLGSGVEEEKRQVETARHSMHLDEKDRQTDGQTGTCTYRYIDSHPRLACLPTTHGTGVPPWVCLLANFVL